MVFHNDVARSVIGIVGNVISAGLFLSPMYYIVVYVLFLGRFWTVPTFYTIWKRKDVEQFSPNPYLATVLNCAMWVLYGLPFIHKKSLLVLTINGAGLVIEFIYISIYFYYANKKQRKHVLAVLAGELVFTAIVVGIVVGAIHTIHTRSLIVGIVAVIFNIAMYAMPLDIMLTVIKTKSAEYLPIYLSFTNLANGICWSIYALFDPFDLFIIISNSSGAVLGLAQVFLFLKYYPTTPKRGEKKASEVQLPTTINDGRISPAV